MAGRLSQLGGLQVQCQPERGGRPSQCLGWTKSASPSHRLTVSRPNQPGRSCLARVAAADSPAPESTIIHREDSDGPVSGRLSQSGPCLRER